MLPELFTMLTLIPAASPTPASQVAPEVCTSHGVPYAAAQYRNTFLAECADGKVFTFSANGRRYAAQGRVENDVDVTAFVPPHRKLSACQGHYFDRESVSISSHDLRVTWNRAHDLEIFHYGRRAVTFNGVTFSNNTNHTVAISASLERL